MHFDEVSRKTLTAVVAIGKRPIREIQILSWVERLKGASLEIFFIFDNFNEENLESEIRSKFDSDLIKINIFHVNFDSPGKSREFGMKLATSEWIVFWDCDDKPANINRVVEILRKDCIDKNILISNYNTISNLTGKSAKSSIPRSLSKWSQSPGLWRVYFRLERVQNTEFERIKMGEDQVFLAICNIEEGETQFVDLVTYEYFTGLSGQLTQNRSRIIEVNYALKSIENYFRSTGKTKSAYQKQIEINLTKSALKIEFITASGIFSQLKYLVESHLMRKLIKLKIQYYLKIGS